MKVSVTGTRAVNEFLRKEMKELSDENVNERMWWLTLVLLTPL